MAREERPLEIEAGAEHDDVRIEKIARLRAAIANGTYSVSAEALAEKMIEHIGEAAPSAVVSADKDAIA
jgi:flagellar biosynthesis anti-sigma factor FlgM